MAAPIILGILLGGGIYYVTRVAPRVAQRAADLQAAKVGASSLRRGTNAHLRGQLHHRTSQPYHAYEYGFLRTMSDAEARALLGFPASSSSSSSHTDGGGVRGMFASVRPSVDEVKAQHRALMKDFHSDVQGTPFLAMKLNEARDILTR